jgi:hypothetical protein
MSNPRPTDQTLGGMTVNERLVVCGVINKWDDAVRRKSRIEMIAVLRGVAMTDHQAIEITDAILLNPGKYGF